MDYVIGANQLNENKLPKDRKVNFNKRGQYTPGYNTEFDLSPFSLRVRAFQSASFPVIESEG